MDLQGSAQDVGSGGREGARAPESAVVLYEAVFGYMYVRVPYDPATGLASIQPPLIVPGVLLGQ